MNETLKNKLAERIAYRVLICGYGIGAATKDVMQWFGVVSEAEMIEITSRAGRLIIADVG